MTMTETALDVEPKEVERKRWTRDECRQLMEMGILEGARFELLGGDIVLKMTQHERHIYTCKQVQKALEVIFGTDYVRLAAPIAISEYEEPEPDAAVMQRPLVDYLRLGTPLPEEVRLTVEVSDRTLRQDLNAKKIQYGRGGIPEYWVININARTLHVFRQPNENGYAREAIMSPEDVISPLAAPSAVITVADLLP